METRQEPNEQTDIIGIRYIPLPDDKREAYEMAIRFFAKLLIEIVNEEELSQVNIEELAAHENSSTSTSVAITPDVANNQADACAARDRS